MVMFTCFACGPVALITATPVIKINLQIMTKTHLAWLVITFAIQLMLITSRCSVADAEISNGVRVACTQQLCDKLNIPAN